MCCCCSWMLNFDYINTTWRANGTPPTPPPAVCALTWPAASISSRKGRHTHQDRCPEEGDPDDPEWGEDVIPADGRDSLCDAHAGSHHQEAPAGLLGSGAQIPPRWKTHAGDDPCVRCLQKGGFMLLLVLHSKMGLHYKVGWVHTWDCGNQFQVAEFSLKVQCFFSFYTSCECIMILEVGCTNQVWYVFISIMWFSIIYTHAMYVQFM